MGGFAETINNLYSGAVLSLSDKEPPVSRDAINKALKNIHDKNFNPETEIEENLFNHTRLALNEATEKGFGNISVGHPDYDFLEQVKYNNAVFAAQKTHRQQNDLVRELTDEKGHSKSFATFAKDTEGIVNNYNREWLQTEQATALKRSRLAVQWKHFEEEREYYPNLKWLPSMAANPRESHKVFYNRVWAYDDSFWDQHRPGDEWGCLCGITSTDEPATGGKISRRDMPEASPGLDNNPADDGALFSDTHPYIKDGYGSQKERQQIAQQAARRATVKDWAEELSGGGKARGRTMEVGSVDKEIKRFLKKQGIKVESDNIVLSDTAIRHMLRDAKPSSVGASGVAKITDILPRCDVYFDTEKNNLLFFQPLENGRVVKYVIAPNYKYRKEVCNYVLTSGVVDKNNMYQAHYKCIKKT